MTLDRAVREALLELIHSEANNQTFFDVVGAHMGRECLTTEEEYAAERETARLMREIRRLPYVTPR